MALGNALGVSASRPLVYSYGPELLTNGGFDTDTVWVKGANWTIASGVATISAPAAASTLTQAMTITSGRTYSVTFTVSGYVSGSVRVRLQNTGVAVSIAPTFFANGTYTVLLTASSAGNEFAFYAPNSSSVLSVDNVSERLIL